MHFSIEYVSNSHAMEERSRAIDKEADSPFEAEVAKALVGKGYHIVQQWQVGAYYIDMVAICGAKKIAIECDGERWHSGEEKIRQDMERQSILERLGWKFIRIRGSEYYRGKTQAIERVVEELSQNGIAPEETNIEIKADDEDELLIRVKTRAAQLLQNRDKIENPPISPSQTDESKEVGSASGKTTQSIQPPPIKEKEVNNEPIQNAFPLPEDDLLAALQLNGLASIDNRKESGILWVIYDSEKKEVFDSLSKRYSFTFAFEKRGALATKGRPAWRVRTQR